MDESLPKLEEMQDILDLKAIEVWDWNLYFLIAAGLLFLVLALWAYQKFFRKKQEEQHTAPPLTPLESALGRLNELAQSGFLEAGKVRRFYFTLSEIFRDFFEEETGIQANEATQEELRPLLKSTEELTGEELQEAYWLIELCDLAKFAKYVPENEEVIKSVKTCRLIISAVAQRREVKRRAEEAATQEATG